MQGGHNLHNCLLKTTLLNGTKKFNAIDMYEFKSFKKTASEIYLKMVFFDE